MGASATISRHGDHFDVFLPDGLRCLTLALVPGRPWRWRWQIPHRRRYLTFSGPLPGAPVHLRWRGPFRLMHAPHGFLLLLDDARLLLCRDGVVDFPGPTHCRPWPPKNWRSTKDRPRPR